MDPEIAAVAREFELGVPIKSQHLNGGSASVLKLRTTLGDFVLKQGELERDLLLYHQVDVALNAVGVRQAHLFAKPDGRFLSSKAFSVFEFLPGHWNHRPTNTQAIAFVNHLVAYNRALSTIAVPSFVNDLDNVWKKANSVNFVLNRIPKWLVGLTVSVPARFEAVSRTIIAYWRQHRSDLDDLPNQLVHGDIGPGNILYGTENAIFIIDFTAYQEPPLYSLCVAFYWHYFYHSHRPRFDRIANDLAIYGSQQGFSGDEKQLFPTIFLKVATTILFVPLLLNLERGLSPLTQEWEKRANIVDAILSNQSKLGDAIESTGR
ncbi:MAG TPA: phosphotransferase [Aggregatilineales bacterium]|nr:phosphotransferase [Aggregatilineales bacterium]